MQTHVQKPHKAYYATLRTMPYVQRYAMTLSMTRAKHDSHAWRSVARDSQAHDIRQAQDGGGGSDGGGWHPSYMASLGDFLFFGSYQHGGNRGAPGNPDNCSRKVYFRFFTLGLIFGLRK